MIHLVFQSGTLLLWDEEVSTQEKPLPGQLTQWCKYDVRVQRWRASASDYAPILAELYHQHVPYDDQARAYEPLNLDFRPGKSPRDYQSAALSAWEKAGRRGVVVLPTGTGKSFLAQLCIAAAARSTLIVVPTLDLLAQWALQLRNAFHCPVGTIGGGAHDVQPITVSTYDSAAMQMEFLGNRFGLLVVDECHHLPGPMYSQLARLAIAPWRLGLTATPERQDGQDAEYANLLGGICFRREITDLAETTVLAPYETISLDVELDADEQQEYNRNRGVYVEFLHRNQISLGSSRGWGFFLRACATQPDGREALKAYLAQRRIARSSRAKLRQIHELLQVHRHDRTLIFTADNATAYRIGTTFCLPVLTHHTKTAERIAFLEAFREGRYPVLVTSKVLNEGVDVPAASVGIIVSGSGSVREHVQRLGRILRPSPGKTALLYELVSLGTSETYVSERRRNHPAYQ
ncbi:MAG: DEAD/DEAH box helicase family protein [Victivallales bacterium]|nr:DEAD/DEAH box helicase family protein [Victivallales bacterium]